MNPSAGQPVSSYRDHLSSADDLVTPYKETRAGFLRLALEKNALATPYVEEAKAIKTLASKVNHPKDLLTIPQLRLPLLTAAGISDKAAGHLLEDAQTEAIQGLIDNFLEPAGEDFVDELVFRFLLTRGDTLGGKVRNIAGVLAERRLTRALIATLAVQGKEFSWLNSTTNSWVSGNRDDPNIELYLRELHWTVGDQGRTLIYNMRVPVVTKNVDLCLINSTPTFSTRRSKQRTQHDVDTYIALGELKGGIDPAGADEHWKTARSALERIRKAFASNGHAPKLFFVGAAIEKAMAEEIYRQIEVGELTNAANLTRDPQVYSLCHWLVSL